MTHSRILIVEDNPLLAMAMEETVSFLGHEVVGPATSLRTGMERAIEGGFDYALLDFDLGAGETSVLIARALLEQGIAFAFVSGTKRGVIREQFSDIPILSKPLGDSDLQTLLAGEWQQPL